MRVRYRSMYDVTWLPGERATREHVTVILRIMVSITVVIFALGSREALADSLWDRLVRQPDAKVSIRKLPDGQETRVVSLPSGVEFHLTKDGDREWITGMDLSGHGAVMCNWGIYIGLRSYLKMCAHGDEEALKVGLDTAIERINGFVIENSIVPATKADVEKAVQLIEQPFLMQRDGKSEAETQEKCRTHVFSKWVAHLKSEPPGALDRAVTDLLSVKRPPVMNPCL